MGQAIVYCSRCNAQLRESDFQKGAAVKVEHKTYCRKCLPPGTVPAPPEKPADFTPSRRRGTTSISIVPVPKPEAPRPILIWMTGVACGVLAVVLALFFFSTPPDPPSPPPEPPTAAPAATLPPALPPEEIAARDALTRLLRRIAEQPTDLDGQQALLDDAVRRSAGTSVLTDVDRERERLARRREDRRATELSELEQQARNSAEDQAAIVLKAARGRYSDAAWIEAIDRLLTAVAPKPTPPPSGPVPAAAAPAPNLPVSAAAPVFPPGWETALRSATARDYAAALTALGQSPDAPLVRAVAALQLEGQQALVRTPRGQKLILDSFGGGRIEGTFIREAGGLLETKTDAGTIEVDLGDLTPSTLIAAARASGTVDPKTAAAFCLIEGDLEGAGTDRSVLSQRFWVYGERVAKSAPEPSRNLYKEALAALAKPASAADAVLRLQALLRDRADDVFVRRNRTAIATRALEGRDFLHLAGDIRASGLFRVGKGGKLDSGWTCESDVDAAKQKETYLEVEFSTLTESAYKAWAYVGGCCQEVFDFSVQGTEMEAGKGTKESAEPGAAAVISVKPYVSGLKKTHSQHNGPKQPARWEWTPIPLPRYAKSGPQRLRILSDQKGFSVACVIVSASRTAPPSDADLKELIRARGERPKQIAQPSKVVPMIVCALDGTDRRLVGDLREKALYGVPMFGMCFTGLERNEALVIPEQGELRFTYFLKSPSPLTARLRINRDGATVPFDIAVPAPVIGTATEVRIPFADFKRAYVKDIAVAPGDTTQMIYIFADTVDCGLRLDALSLIEIRK